MTDTLRLLPPSLVAEDGGGFVSIWRDGDAGDHTRSGTVGDWLSVPAHQQGEWLIDGGWGGPPGPLTVRWNATAQAWENLGFPA